jgi:hypothetical protein
MNPLETALRPVASVLNRNIRSTTPARELCEKLDGSVIAVFAYATPHSQPGFWFTKTIWS